MAIGLSRTPTPLRIGVLALLWGSTFLWIDLALDGFTAAQVTVARCGIGAVVLLMACRFAGHRLPRGRLIWGRIAIAAFFCNALPFALFSIGQQSVDSGVAGVLNATTPLWSIPIAVAVGGGGRMSRSRLGGLILGFAGIVLIFAPWQQTGMTSWGAAAILGAAISYAVAFAYMGRRLAGTGTSTVSLAAGQLIVATGITALMLPTEPLAMPRFTAASLLAVAVLGIFCTAITFYLTYRVIAEEGATNAAAVGYLLPVVSVLLGALVLGEVLNGRIIVGMVVVLVGVAFTRRRPRRAVSRPHADPVAVIVSRGT